MYNTERALQVLFGRVGWKPDTFNLSDENKKSLSGRNFQSFHKIVTLKNVYENMETENAGDDEFNDYLKDLQSNAILACLSGIYNENELIEQSLLFNGKNPTPQKYSGTVGYKLKLPEGYTVVLKSVSLLFDRDSEIELFLNHSTNGEIWSKKLECKENKQAVHQIDLSLHYSTNEYKGGFFYFGYKSGDAIPLELEPEWSKTNILGYTPEGETSNTYGLNIEFCSYRDYTKVIENNSHLFDTVIGLQVAATVVELILNSTRSNKTQRISKEAGEVLYNDLNTAFPTNEFPYTTGLRNQLAREIKRLKTSKETFKIVTPCFT
jgi:hypothetical protein